MILKLLRSNQRTVALILGYSAAFAALLVGGGWTNIQQAVAGQSSYSETWTASEYRALFYGSYPSCAIGPSKWTVTGTSGTTAWSETWSADSWADSVAHYNYDSGGVQPYSYGNSPEQVPIQYLGGTRSIASASCGSGLYGWLRVDQSRYGVQSEYVTDTKGGGSWPRKWTVTGTITTP